MEWIKVEDHLPVHSTDILVTRRVGYLFNRRPHCSDRVEMLWYDAAGHKFIDINGNRVLDNQILAWMPLPEPFKEED